MICSWSISWSIIMDKIWMNKLFAWLRIKIFVQSLLWGRKHCQYNQTFLSNLSSRCKNALVIQIKIPGFESTGHLAFLLKIDGKQVSIPCLRTTFIILYASWVLRQTIFLEYRFLVIVQCQLFQAFFFLDSEHTCSGTFFKLISWLCNQFAEIHN